MCICKTYFSFSVVYTALMSKEIRKRIGKYMYMHNYVSHILWIYAICTTQSRNSQNAQEPIEWCAFCRMHRQSVGQTLDDL